MEASTTIQLSDIVAAIERHIQHIRSLGLKQPALLLEMAKLDLQMRVHDISDVELDELCKAIERQGEEARRVDSPAPLPERETTTSTVISLFGGNRVAPNARPQSANTIPENALRGIRGRTLVPR